MIEKLRRSKRRYTVMGWVICLPLLVVALAGTREVSALAAFSLIAVIVVTSIIEKKIDGRIYQLLEEENRGKPLVNTPATVASYCVRHKYWTYGGHRAILRSTPCWYVTFFTPNHGEVELNVPHDVYMYCREGVKGQLRYQGWKFISFKQVS